jgi:hypothetical protein
LAPFFPGQIDYEFKVLIFMAQTLPLLFSKFRVGKVHEKTRGNGGDG